MQDEIKAGHVQVMLNAGDHKHMKTAFLETLAKVYKRARAHTHTHTLFRTLAKYRHRYRR